VEARTTLLVVADAADLDELAALAAAAAGSPDALTLASTAVGALAAVGTDPPAVVLLGVRHSPEQIGPGLLDELSVCAPGTPVVLVAPSELSEEADRRGVERIGWKGAGRGKLRDALERASAPEQRRLACADAAAHVRALSFAIDHGLVVCSMTGRVLEVNAAASTILGRPAAELRFGSLGDDSWTGWSDAEGRPYPPEQLPLAVVLRLGGHVQETICRISTPAGDERIVECSATPLARADGTAYCVVVSLRDVTAACAAHDALVAAERRQHLLLEHAAEGYLVVDARGRVLEASASISRFWPLEDVVGADGRLLVHRDDRDAMRRLFVAVVTRRNETARAEMRVVDSAESVRWAEITLTDRLAEPTIGGVVINVRDITARKGAEERMAQLSAIVESSIDSIVWISLDGRISSWNPSSERLYGFSASEVVGGPAHLVVAEHERDRLAGLLEDVGRGEHVYVPVVDAVRADGSAFELSLSISPVYGSAGGLVGVSSIGRDITERRQLEQARRLAEERCRLGFERGAIGMVMFDADGTVTRVNAALCTLLGRRERELVGANAESFIHPDDVAIRQEMLGELLCGARNHFRAERRLLRADAEIIWALVDVTAVRDADGEVAYIFGQLQDITARKRVERVLEQQALHDALTGLPNRLALEHRLARALERAVSEGTKVAVLFVDVDNFKLVNDGLGHVVGDRVLVELAGRLAAGVRIGDTTARFGGDEFLVVCEGVADEDEARQLAQRVLGLVDRPIRVDGRDIALTVSCGVAVVDGTASPEVALRGADEAMYRAKENGRARVEVFGGRVRRAAAPPPLVERTVVEVAAVAPASALGDGQDARLAPERAYAPGA